MTDVDGVRIPFEVDDKDFRAKFDEMERRLKKFESDGTKSAKKGSSAFLGGVVGGAIGFIAGAATNNPATNAVADLLLSVIAASLLPVMEALLPLIQALLPVLSAIAEKLGAAIESIVSNNPDTVSVGGLAAGGAAVGGYVGGVPGAAIGGASGAGLGLAVERNEMALDGIRDWAQSAANKPTDPQYPSSSGGGYTHAPTPSANRERTYGPDPYRGG